MQGMSRRTPAQVARSRELRGTMTPHERRVWWHLRELNRQGAHFRRQAAIGRYFVDFADLGRGIVVEIDGGQHAGGADRIRDAWIAGRGFRVLRFWNADVDSALEGVMGLIAEAVREADAARGSDAAPRRGVRWRQQRAP